LPLQVGSRVLWLIVTVRLGELALPESLPVTVFVLPRQELGELHHLALAVGRQLTDDVIQGFL
jgi:hypothetical protein